MAVESTNAYNSGYNVGRQAVIERAKVSKVQTNLRERPIDPTTGQKGLRPRGPAMRTSSTYKEEKENFQENAKNMAVRGGMLLFWLVAGIAVAKDLIDVFSALLDLAGFGLAATAIGAPIGIPIMAFSELIDKISGILIDFTLVAYFGYIGGGFALRLVIIGIGAIIDMIPFVDLLPLTTVSFFAAYLLGRAAKKAIEVANSSPVRAVAGGAKFAKNTGARVGRILKYVS